MRTQPGFGVSSFSAGSQTRLAITALLPTNWTSSILPRVLAQPAARKMSLAACMMCAGPIQRLPS